MSRLGRWLAGGALVAAVALPFSASAAAASEPPAPTTDEWIWTGIPEDPAVARQESTAAEWIWT